MGWIRGDVWLDTDVLWFRKGAGEALEAVVPFAEPPAPPPGLIASRTRRDASRRRRSARRTRAAVLAVSPAVIFPLAAARNAAGQGPKLLAEDPPTQTFHLTPAMGGDRPVPGAVLVRSPATKPKRAQRSLRRVHALPKVDWHHATSVGLPFAGRLIDGTQLPASGPNWVTWDPVTDSVPNEPVRLYGNERTIHAILSVTAAYRAANPGAPRVVVGDISLEGGGPMTDEHVSHQNGLDADVYYPRRDRKLAAPVESSQIDRRLAQDLLDRFVAAGAQVIFVGYSTGLHGPAGVVVPYPNHEYHMHVRFPEPAR
jgi:Penicillin-insensitive murein endopeptidase